MLESTHALALKSAGGIDRAAAPIAEKDEVMRFILLLFLLPSICFGGDWTKEDTYRQTALAALLVTDWAQTRWIVKNPQTTMQPSSATGRPGPMQITSRVEGNPILGEHPSIGKVNNYFAASLVGHAAIAYLLPPELRNVWQYGWLLLEADAVVHNRSAGVKFNF